MPNMDDFSIKNKDLWLWKILVVQPDFVTKADFDLAVESVKGRNDPAALPKVRFEILNEGYSAQILYIGPFVDEGPTIEEAP